MEFIKHIIDNYPILKEQDKHNLNALTYCYEILQRELNSRKFVIDKCTNANCKNKIKHVPMSITYNNGQCRKCAEFSSYDINFQFIPMVDEMIKMAKEDQKKEIIEKLKNQDTVHELSFIKQPMPGLPKSFKAKISNLNISSL